MADARPSDKKVFIYRTIVSRSEDNSIPSTIESEALDWCRKKGGTDIEIKRVSYFEGIPEASKDECGISVYMVASKEASNGT